MYIIKAINISTGMVWYLRYWTPSDGTTHFEWECPHLFHSINEARYVLGISVGRRPNVRGWKFMLLKAKDKYKHDKFIYCIRCR